MAMGIGSALSASDCDVTLPDGTKARYRMRGLEINPSDNGRREDHSDVARWTKFCASVFAYKDDPPPPSYFARHFYNDPRRDPALVRVLTHRWPLGGGNDEEEEEIASSVRIFRRTLSTGPAGDDTAIEAGGIGEVCTSPEHRRRGLSRILLDNAVKIMTASSRGKGGMSCSLLHASPDFRPFYSMAAGYQCVRSEWSSVPVRLNCLSANRISEDRINDDWLVRNAIFPGDSIPGDAERLRELHRKYSEGRLITVVRTVQYWKEYVSAELGDTLWVLARPHDTGDPVVSAWISIRRRRGRYQLREFGVDKDARTGVGTAWAMRRLLGVAMEQVGERAGSGGTPSLLMPSFVLAEMAREASAAAAGYGDGHGSSFLDVGAAVEENDEGWMYLDLGAPGRGPTVFELTNREADPVPHVIWPTDSF